MRVAILLFNLSNIGGIITWANQMKVGFTQLGIVSDIIYLNRSGRTLKDNTIDGRDVDVKKVLGYSKDNIKRYKKYMRRYDFAIFAVACPHMNKANINNPEWMDCYRKLKMPIVSVVHDQYWDSTKYGYRWLTEVKDKISYIVAVKEPDYRSTENFPGEVRLIHWPLNVDDVGYKKKKKDMIISMSQWRPWKFVWHLLKIAPMINVEEVRFHNRGINYYQFKKGSYYGDVKDKYWPRAMKKNATYAGYLTDYEDCIKAYKESIAVVDFSYRRNFPGIYNYTAIECMLYRCVPIMYPQVLKSNFITEKEVYVVDMVENGKKGTRTAKQINMLLENENLREQYIGNNMEFVKKHFDAKKIAEKFMQLV